MNSSRFRCFDAELRRYASQLGISAVGVARIDKVDDKVIDFYNRWLRERRHGGMAYLEKYPDIRRDPELLLPGAKSIISAAFNYYPANFQPAGNPQFAYYSYGMDYHEVVRQRLSLLAGAIAEKFGCGTRVCVDTAPLFERYWAVKAGLGFIGLNSQLIIPGKGSYFVLGEILTTTDLEPGTPMAADCGKCGACIKRCPAGAIGNDGTVDASKCLSYLTIEHRGELPDGIDLGNRVFGCDECQKACPHNRRAEPSGIEEFRPSELFLSLDMDKLKNLDKESFNAIFRHSAVKRTKLSGLLRNVGRLTSDKDFVPLQRNPEQ